MVEGVARAAATALAIERAELVEEAEKPMVLLPSLLPVPQGVKEAVGEETKTPPRRAVVTEGDGKQREKGPEAKVAPLDVP